MKVEIEPVHPAAPWIGGKRNLVGRIVPLIDGDNHKLYAEPFVGMGGVFLRRTGRPTAEVINDAGRDISNLFRILQRHYPQFLDTLKFQVTSRAEFERMSRVAPETLTDLERAARFLYLQRTAFGGKVAGQTFGVAAERPARFDLTQVVPMLEDLHTRLAGVTIECLDFEAFIERYDRPSTLFYLDPPYWGSETDYGKDLFSRSDFTRLADVLASIDGRFLLSINDCAEVRDVFGRFDLIELQTTYSVGQGAAVSASELLYTNAGWEQSMPLFAPAESSTAKNR
ncbi:MAG: DNA adenine methylase [Pseudomonadota bacterium]